MRARLPDYMVPLAFDFLGALPLNRSGKLDRRALGSPSFIRRRESRLIEAPRTDLEQRIAKIFRDVLRLDEIGIHENLFDLGGHSLLAIQVIARIRDAFQIELPLHALFESPTVAGLSALIVQKQAEGLGEDELAQLLSEAQEQGSQP